MPESAPTHQASHRAMARTAAVVLAMAGSAGYERAATAEAASNPNPMIQETESSLENLLAKAEKLSNVVGTWVRDKNGEEHLTFSVKDDQKNGKPLYDQLVLNVHKGQKAPYESMLLFGAHSARYEKTEKLEKGRVLLHLSESPGARYVLEIKDYKTGSLKTYKITDIPPPAKKFYNIDLAYTTFFEGAKQFLEGIQGHH